MCIRDRMETYAVLREAFLSGEPGSVEQINAFKKNVTGRVIPKSERERLEIFERMLSGMQAQGAPQIPGYGWESTWRPLADENFHLGLGFTAGVTARDNWNYIPDVYKRQG